jgi:hypothetical protein
VAVPLLGRLKSSIGGTDESHCLARTGTVPTRNKVQTTCTDLARPRFTNDDWTDDEDDKQRDDCYYADSNHDDDHTCPDCALI